MKKILNQTLALLAGATFFASCAKEWTIIPNEFAQDGAFTISATLEDLGTKVSFGAPSYTGGKPSGSMATTWESGDKLRVYNHADHSQYSDFTLDEGAGTKSASFTGSPVAASSYDVEVIDCSGAAAATVTMASDGAVANLKYLATATSVTDLTQISFANVSSVLAVTAKLPAGVAGTITSVKMTASEDIFFGGNEQTINITTPGDDGSDNILHLFATLPEGDVNVPAGTTILVKFNSNNDEHEVYTRFVEMAATTFDANACNTININATASATHAGLATADGSTSAKAYLIGDKYQMQAMQSLLTAGSTTYFKMVDDVDLDGVAWEPLNHVSPYSKAIDFDGDFHTISHLSSSSTYKLPSFAGVLNGSVRNVVFDSATITCGGEKGGVLAGYIGENARSVKGSCSNVVIENSTVNSTVMAGILAAQGDNIQVVTGCFVNNSSITSTGARIGGLIGSVVAFEEISDCGVDGLSLTGSSYYNGGFIGQLDGTGTIRSCHSGGSVTTIAGNYSRSGGFIGLSVGGTVERCYSTCSVSLNGVIGGGFVGQVQKADISKCYATGDVSASGSDVNAVGGFVGYITGTDNVQIAESYATGSFNPNGSSASAGFVAKVDGSGTHSIHDCYATGSLVTANSYGCGGFAGNIAGDFTGTITIARCYATGNIAVSYGYSRGGVVGRIETTHATVEKCAAWNGRVQGQTGLNKWSAGAVVGVAHPLCTLTDNYRNPDMTLHGYWGNSGQTLPLTSSYQHENVSSSAALITVDKDGNLTRTTKTALTQDGSSIFAYQGKCVSGQTLSQLASSSSYLNWSSSIWDFNQNLPRLKWTLE
ncbi:MAG: hypothetical protein J6Y32_00130 [Bacteroidales bacterium]|nr:hypothetical protein [Bacteroidales bacterium]